MDYRKLFVLASGIYLWFIPTVSVRAMIVPSFPACASPQGTVKVSYPSGTHGIVGDPKNYTGSDTVYTLTDTTLLQCFCAQDGSGIQTNWWKVSSMSQEEVDELVSEGWIYVPNGSVWGLDESAYLVKNNQYSCKGGTGGGGSSGSGDSGSSSGGTGGGSVSSTVGQVLGLATTGDSRLVLGFLVLTLISLLGAFVWRNHV